jgi:predicted RND superfamily exporter protein
MANHADEPLGDGTEPGLSDASQHSHLYTFGLANLGLLPLRAHILSAIVIVLITALAVAGVMRLKVDDSLSELFRSDTKEFHQYEEIDKRFPSSEYDVLVVVEGASLLAKPQLEAFRNMVIDLQLEDGVAGLVSMLSARGKPDAAGYPPPIVPDELPDDQAAYAEIIDNLKNNDIVKGKFLSDDGKLAMVVISLDRQVVHDKTAKVIIGGIQKTIDEDLKDTGLTAKLTGAPVMQLEIRNAVERDQFTYNGLGLLFGAVIAAVFFRRASLMLVAAVPPVLAVVWSLGLLGWLDFRLNLFLNVMTPLVMVMGFADSMQMVSAIRIRLREGANRVDAAKFAVRVVAPACVVAHGATILSFSALLLSDSALIRTFGAAGAIATMISYVAVIVVLPLLAVLFIRNEEKLSRDRTPADALMDGLGHFVGRVVDRVTLHPIFYSALGLVLFALFTYGHSLLQPRYRLADQVPDREQALSATGQLDQKLTGANPVHVMIQWKGSKNSPADGGISLFDPATLAVIAAAHDVLEKEAGLGNVWSLDSLRRWLAESGDSSVETIKKYVGLLPDNLVRRFISADENSVLVTARLPDMDASEILPVVEKIDHALDPVRKAHPGYEISVTGLPAIAARNSARMIEQLNEKIFICVGVAAVLLAIAFRSLFVGVISILPGLFPVMAAGTLLWAMGNGLEFASAVALIIIFGLGVDALVHFINRLLLEEEKGGPPELAIRRARILVGPAIILTTVVLAFGLGVTVFSGLPSLRTFGLVCGVTLLASLVADLVFLPATILLYRRYITRAPVEPENAEA